MNNITHKVSTLRTAIAQAVVTVSSAVTMEAIISRKVPKGDVVEFSRAAGLLAIKKTSDVIPDCHPLPVEFAAIRHRMEDLRILVEVEVHTIYKTGVEVEAMHGASIAALTMYDMLKPLDSGIEISSIRLLRKEGGKRDFTNEIKRSLKAAVIVCSDSIFAGKKTDRAGKAIRTKLEQYGMMNSMYEIIPDEVDTIRAKVVELCDLKTDLVLFTGGTGLSPRDVTPEAIRPLLEREIPGIMEAARQYGQQRTPYAMLSRSLAGIIGNTVVLTLPGSTRGAEETMDALFPYILHIFAVMDGTKHEKAKL